MNIRTGLLSIASVALIALTTFAANSPVTAQDATAAATQSTNANCTPSTVLKSFTSLTINNDQAKDLATLLTLRDKIDAQEAACNGLFFKGTGDKVLGPANLPAGIYKVHLVTDGFFIAHLQVISGDCASDGFGSLFSLSVGDAKDGSDALINSKGCRMLIATSDVSAPFTLEFTSVQ